MAGTLAVTAKASTTRTIAVKIKHQEVRYYHADGYIKAIGHAARRTIYSPNFRTRHKWQAALKYLIQIRTNSAHQIYALKHPQPTFDHFLLNAFLCIHRYEGAWNANTGNGYYGGLQMDSGFMARYGLDYLGSYGTADKWPPMGQIAVAIRAYKSGRGFYPWPNTAKACGLL